MVHVPKKGFFVISSLYAVHLSGHGTEFTEKRKLNSASIVDLLKLFQ